MNYFENLTHNDNDNDDIMPQTQRNKPFPFVKKIRPIAKTPTLIVSIPNEMCHLLELDKGDRSKVYCEIDTGKIIMDKINQNQQN